MDTGPFDHSTSFDTPCTLTDALQEAFKETLVEGTPSNATSYDQLTT